MVTPVAPPGMMMVVRGAAPSSTSSSPSPQPGSSPAAPDTATANTTETLRHPFRPSSKEQLNQTKTTSPPESPAVGAVEAAGLAEGNLGSAASTPKVGGKDACADDATSEEVLRQLTLKNVDLGRQMVARLTTLLDQIEEAKEQISAVSLRQADVTNTTDHYKEMAQILMSRVKEDDEERVKLKKELEDSFKLMIQQKDEKVENNTQRIQQLRTTITEKDKERTLVARKIRRIEGLLKQEQVKQLESVVVNYSNAPGLPITAGNQAPLLLGDGTAEHEANAEQGAATGSASHLTPQSVLALFSSPLYAQTADETTHQFMYAQRRELRDFLHNFQSEESNTLPGEYQRITTPQVDSCQIPGAAPEDEESIDAMEGVPAVPSLFLLENKEQRKDETMEFGDDASSQDSL